MKSRTKDADPAATTSTTDTSGTTASTSTSGSEAESVTSVPQSGTASATDAPATDAPATPATPAASTTNGTTPAAAPAPAAPTKAETPKPAKPAKAPKPIKEAKESKPSRRPSAKQATAAVNRVRNLLAQVVWLVCLAGALVLAIAALLIAVKASNGNELVKFMKDFADNIDFGIFDLDSPIKNFDGKNAIIKEALLNYGVGAVVYLVVGRIAERIIKP